MNLRTREWLVVAGVSVLISVCLVKAAVWWINYGSI